jgi:hypothetical protein
MQMILCNDQQPEPAFSSSMIRRRHMTERLCSQYLLRPRRTLPEACREITARQPEQAVKKCGACAHVRLCASYERIERDRHHQIRTMGGACETPHSSPEGAMDFA